MFHHGFCNSSALQPHEDNLLHLPLPHFFHLWMGNSVISACSLVTERRCQWQEILIKTPWVLESKSSIQMSVRLLQANMNNPITEETISWSILKKERNLTQGGKCTGEGRVILESRSQSQRLSVTLSEQRLRELTGESALQRGLLAEDTLHPLDRSCALWTGSTAALGTNTKSSKGRDGAIYFHSFVCQANLPPL